MAILLLPILPWQKLRRITPSTGCSILPVGTCKKTRVSQRLRIIYVIVSRSHFFRSKEYPLFKHGSPVMFERLSKDAKQYFIQMNVGFSLALSTPKNTWTGEVFPHRITEFLPLPTLILSLILGWHIFF